MASEKLEKTKWKIAEKWPSVGLYSQGLFCEVSRLQGPSCKLTTGYIV